MTAQGMRPRRRPVFGLMGERPLFVTRQMAGPVLLGFITSSSEVALPLHLEKLEAIGVPNHIVSVVLSLGYSFKFDGTALIASRGVANVPSGSLVALSTVSLALGLPAEAGALMTGVDVFLDVGRAAMNAFDNTLSVLVARRFTESYIEAPADATTVIG
jgi:dicarboxylate/amino acid:cation (Na+ or H+) symporter, DAACS family